jgi:hypothetical protein
MSCDPIDSSPCATGVTENVENGGGIPLFIGNEQKQVLHSINIKGKANAIKSGYILFSI